MTKVQGFRGTICGIDSALKNYLIDKINGLAPVEVLQAHQELESLKKTLGALVQGLWWKDFELLVDLIFSQSGWQRLSVNGQTEKSIDLDLLAPVTGKKAFVQVKSQANLSVLQESVNHFSNMLQYDEFYFVVHTNSFDLETYRENDPRVHVIGLERIVDLIINAGLIQWLLNRRS